jgi:hypothetical protein
VAGGFAATADQSTRLYGIVTFFNETLDNAKVTITLTGADYFTTSTLSIAPGQIVTDTDTAGYFGATVFLTDSLSGNATYTIRIEQPEIQAGGIKVEINGLSITTADSVSLREVLAQ